MPCVLKIDDVQSDDDGDVIDCVDIYQQPALKHAPLGSRVIQVGLSL